MIWCVEDDASIRDIELYALRSAGLEAEGFYRRRRLLAGPAKRKARPGGAGRCSPASTARSCWVVCRLHVPAPHPGHHGHRQGRGSMTASGRWTAARMTI